MSILGLSLREQADQQAIEAVKAAKPSQFTVGGTFDGHIVSGGVTFDRKFANGYGLTAYVRAWWNDASVSTHGPTVEAGGEFVKKF